MADPLTHPTDDPSALRDALAAVHADCRAVRDGAVADYIPALAEVDPDVFAIAACTVDGQIIAVGDVDAAFTLQSVSKPFLYAAALARHGSEHVHRFVGVEPIGEGFDAFLRLESGTHRPHNPMINAGAITVAGMLDSAAGVEAILDVVRAWAGDTDVHVDMATFASEWETNDRNRAIAHLLRQFGVLATDVERALELYTYACAMRVTAAQLATMGAVLANGGVHPRSGQRLLAAERAAGVLTLMMTCGLYDGAGRFAVDVGVPAKSGVSGAIVAVVPGRLALAVYSPRLDTKGNSVRGVAALRALSERLDLSVFDERDDPSWPEASLRDALHAAEDAARAVTGGAVAPYLKPMGGPADRLAIAVCTTAGAEVAVGDVTAECSIQAVANPFAYALALGRHAWAAVDAKVGVASSGNPFDAILLDPRTGRPYNPLNNAGAITVASLASAPHEVADGLSAFAGVDHLLVDPAVFAAEQREGHRNRAIAHLLRSLGVIADVPSALDVYFQQCAVRVTAPLLARMGATLAAGGRQPQSGRVVVSREVARRVMAVMYTCGLHDASGRFAFDVGVPAKSGIGGALVAVVPGVMGIAMFSPRVDAQGTSVRGGAALRHVVRALGLGLFAVPPQAG